MPEGTDNVFDRGPAGGQPGGKASGMGNCVPSDL
jgi:hypothetical protein